MPTWCAPAELGPVGEPNPPTGAEPTENSTRKRTCFCTTAPVLPSATSLVLHRSIPDCPRTCALSVSSNVIVIPSCSRIRIVSLRVAIRLFVEQSTYVCALQLNRLENHPLNSPTGEDKMDGIPGGVGRVGEPNPGRFPFRVFGCKSSVGTAVQVVSDISHVYELAHLWVSYPFLVPFRLFSRSRRRADYFEVPSQPLHRASSQSVLQWDVSGRFRNTCTWSRNARYFPCSLDLFQSGAHLRAKSAQCRDALVLENSVIGPLGVTCPLDKPE